MTKFPIMLYNTKNTKKEMCIRDSKKIKDLQQLRALLQEVEDYAAANEDGDPGDAEDAAPAPA